MARTKAADRAAAEREGYPDLAPETEVEISHPDTGQDYGVTLQAFRDLYQPLGYVVDRRADNTPLHPDQVEAPESGPEPILVPDNAEGDDAPPVTPEG